MSSEDLDTLLRTVRSAAAGYSADAIAVVIEGVFPVVETNPITGREWLRGEAEQVFVEHNGVDRGWVAEAQILAMADRMGAIAEEAWPFRAVRGSVVWGAEPLAFSATGLTDVIAGHMIGPVVDATRVPDPGEGFIGDSERGPFYDRDRGRVVLDVGCTHMLEHEMGGHGQVIIFAASAAHRDRLLREGLALWQVEMLPGAVDGPSHVRLRGADERGAFDAG
ncbi:hypothetical protein [Microbacterium karelineae]|uniref:hypothetical protein n=1 Tax=Microbacterium karelineae TaxID=2654283 RepID=UPI0012EB03E4|nr:hypothetical protein [Microbacterium karelineae]